RCNSCKNRRPITDFPLKRGADPDDPDAERLRTCQPCKTSRLQRHERQHRSREATPERIRMCQPCKDARHQRRQRQRAAREEPPNDAERRRCSSCRNTRPLTDFPPKRGADPDDPNPERALTCVPCKVSRDRRRLQQLASRDAARAAAARASQVAALPSDDDTIPFSPSSSPPQRRCTSCRTCRPVTEFVSQPRRRSNQNASAREFRTCASCRERQRLRRAIQRTLQSQSPIPPRPTSLPPRRSRTASPLPTSTPRTLRIIRQSRRA
ncbi:hypothetical protein E4U22_002220, partial [Claviceps purpurea]